MKKGRMSMIIPTRKGVIIPQQNQKKNALPAIEQNSNGDDTDTKKQPISDYPSPPVQIVSCRNAQSCEVFPLPTINTAPSGEIPQLSFQKLKQCCRICDFSDPNVDVVSKDTKKAALNELIGVYSNSKLVSRLSRDCHAQLIEMFAANVFRPPPNIPRALLLSDEVTFEDSAWPHLSLVYVLFQKFLVAKIDPRILQFQLTPRFISQLFAVLNFPDDRERVQAKNVIKEIFNKVPPQRPLLRLITTSLLTGVPEGVMLNATGYLLELFHAFTMSIHPPLPPQLISAFEKVILPLHLSSRMSSYHSQLTEFVLLMIKKNASLSNVLLKFLITHWPLTHDKKSELFIDEVAQILAEASPQVVNDNMPDLMECVCFAAESPSMTLAEKALLFMINPRVQVSIAEKPYELISQVFPSLFRAAREHWHRNCQTKALEVMNTLMELNPTAFEKVASQFKAQVRTYIDKMRSKKFLWECIAAKAVKNDAEIDPLAVKKDMNAYFGIGRPRRHHTFH